MHIGRLRYRYGSWESEEFQNVPYAVLLEPNILRLTYYIPYSCIVTYSVPYPITIYGYSTFHGSYPTFYIHTPRILYSTPHCSILIVPVQYSTSCVPYSTPEIELLHILYILCIPHLIRSISHILYSHHTSRYPRHISCVSNISHCASHRHNFQARNFISWEICGLASPFWHKISN